MGFRFRKKAFGSWSSPITSELLAQAGSSIGQVVADSSSKYFLGLSGAPTAPGQTGTLGEEGAPNQRIAPNQRGSFFFSESRPAEGGRTAVMYCTAEGLTFEVTPKNANVRTRVHEYGGGAFWAQDAILYYSEFSDGRIYSLDCSVYDGKHDLKGKAAAPKSAKQKNPPSPPNPAPPNPPNLSSPPNPPNPSNLPAPKALTPEDSLCSYADFRLLGSEWLVCVREKHISVGESPDSDVPEPTESTETSKPAELLEPTNEIVAVKTDGSGEVAVLISGADFYSSPRVDFYSGAAPTDNKLAWLEWNHPNMPWDATCLWTADIDLSDSIPKLKNKLHIAGSQENSDPASSPEWIFQPEWQADGSLTFVSDSNGWSQLMRVPNFAPDTAAPENSPSQDEPTSQIVLDIQNAEIAVPPWVFAESRYGINQNQMAFAVKAGGEERLFVGRLPEVAEASQKTETAEERRETEETKITETSQAPQNESAFTRVLQNYSGFAFVQPFYEGFLVLASSWDKEPEIIYVHAPAPTGVAPEDTTPTEPAPIDAIEDISKTSYEVLHRTKGTDIDRSYFPPPRHITFPAQDFDGFEGSAEAHAFYYAPANPKFKGPKGEPPPLIVMAHGGPTAAARTCLHLGHRFWTSRGFGVLDVDYRGSTGYGRRYKRALEGRWGLLDVSDCVDGARFLSDQKLVNPEAMAVRGGSAGGLTVLLALAWHDVFTAGSNSYGVADLAALVATTHKFESRYLDRLIGPPEVFPQRSPINFVDKISAPMIVLQGEDDKVVPPSQSEVLVQALAQNDIPHEYILFPDEGHGFRKAETVIEALEAELAFFRKVFAT